MTARATGLVLLLLVSGLYADPSRAQSSALVVAVCGTLPLAFKAGATQPITQDVTGTLCSSSSGGGGGGNVNLTQILGAAPSLTNPLWVFPATGATFPVSGTFYQTTQPVSGTFWQTTQPVSLATAPTTPVTGTFWQTTQPVSGTFYQTTQPVSGTFYQATQPVSAATGTFASGSLAAGSMVDLLTMRAPIGGTTSSPADVLVGGCQYNSGAQTYTTGDSGAIQCTINGYPIVQVNNTNANITPADTASNPTTTSPIVGFNEVWNGSTWDRMPGSAAAGATVSPASTYVSGKLISSLVKGTTAAMTGTTSTQLLAAVSGKVIYVMNVDCVNSSTTATLVTLQDGSAGTALGTVAAAASGGGHAIHATFPETWTTSGNGLYVADVTTGASVICTASGFAQ